MAQTGYTPIQLYRSSTGAAAPTAGNLADGELAINFADGKLYYKDSLGAVQLLANKANSGIIPVTQGGTGLATLTANNVMLGNGASNVSFVAPGTSGNLLTSNGTTWASSAPPPSPAMVLLATLTPTASPSLNSLAIFSSTYDNYKIVGKGLKFASSTAMRMRFAVAGSVDSSTKYNSCSNATFTGLGLTSAFDQGPLGGSSLPSTSLGGNFEMTIMNVNSTTNAKTYTSMGVTTDSAGGITVNSSYGGYSATNAVSGISFYSVSGANFELQGSIEIYGYVKS